MYRHILTWSLPWLLPFGAIYELQPLRPVEAREMTRSIMQALPALVGIEEQSLEIGASSDGTILGSAFQYLSMVYPSVGNDGHWQTIEWVFTMRSRCNNSKQKRKQMKGARLQSLSMTIKQLESLWCISVTWINNYSWLTFFPGDVDQVWSTFCLHRSCSPMTRRSNSNAGKKWIKLDLRATDIIILLTAFFHPKFLPAWNLI